MIDRQEKAEGVTRCLEHSGQLENLGEVGRCVEPKERYNGGGAEQKADNI